MEQNQSEEWRPIPDFPGYEVSNLGRVKSFIKRKTLGRILKPVIGIHGYWHIQLRKNNKGKTKRIHRIVLETFIGKSDLYCNHKNAVKTDNRLENLEYCTHAENVQHAVSLGLVGGNKGTKSWNARLDDDKVREIRKKGETIKAQMARYGMSRASIVKVRLRETWRHVCG